MRRQTLRMNYLELLEVHAYPRWVPQYISAGTYPMAHDGTRFLNSGSHLTDDVIHRIALCIRLFT